VGRWYRFCRRWPSFRRAGRPADGRGRPSLHSRIAQVMLGREWLLSLLLAGAYPHQTLLKFGKLASWRFSFAGLPGLAMGSAPAQSESSRRMTRVRVEVPVRLATLAPAPLFAEESHTLVVNPQGCGVKLSRALKPGTRVLLDGLPGDAQVTAQVANCLPLGSDGKWFLLGLALDTPGNIWGITEPPADWTIEELPAAAPAAPAEDPVKKKN
jgi:hypothetical protein